MMNVPWVWRVQVRQQMQGYNLIFFISFEPKVVIVKMLLQRLDKLTNSLSYKLMDNISQPY